MKVFFDCEFTGLQKDTELISIGMVSENGKLFYAEFTDYDKSKVDDWIQENVIDNLIFNKHNILETDTFLRGTKEKIKEKLTSWLSQFNTVDLVSDVCHFDMVLFTDIFGSAFDLPDNVTPACYDINQDIQRYYDYQTSHGAFDKSREAILEEHGIEVKGCKHNSLYDARVIEAIYRLMNE